MDRRYLSDARVVAASRDFVCIRLATYESKEEAELLKSIFLGRSGELENTVFALLAPSGEKIGGAGRTPEFAYAGPEPMAEAMKQIAAKYPGRKDDAHEFPRMKDLRLALNVAACDGLPLLVALAPDREELARMEQRLKPVVWGKEAAGRFIHCSLRDAKELAPVSGVTRKSGLLLIQPDAFGLKGSMLLELDAELAPAELEKGLARARSLFKTVEKDPSAHIREANRRGLHWETLIPDTDPGPGAPPKK